MSRRTTIKRAKTARKSYLVWVAWFCSRSPIFKALNDGFERIGSAPKVTE